jgi:uncharacterized Tic20 family protein
MLALTLLFSSSIVVFLILFYWLNSANKTRSFPLEVSQNNEQIRRLAMMLHFSLLANFLVPISGFIAAIAIWLIFKKDQPAINSHGKIIMNWIMTMFLVGVLPLLILIMLLSLLQKESALVTYCWTGLMLMAGLWLVLGILNIVFPIIAGIKASNGLVWKYPFSIRFLK